MGKYWNYTSGDRLKRDAPIPFDVLILLPGQTINIDSRGAI